MSYYKITCPKCGVVGDEDAFELSQADECYCPVCGVEFLIDEDDDEEDEEDVAEPEGRSDA